MTGQGSRALFLKGMAALMLCFGGLSAPASSQSPPPAAVAAPQPAVTSPAASDDYVLGVADQIRITVYNEPNLTGQYPINANGTVSTPLIGDVQAAGLTSNQLRAEIESKLANGYLVNPSVSIDVLTFRPFYILGEVTKPGEYPCSSGLTVLNAVATAQGFTYRANKKYVFVKHAGTTDEKRTPLTDGLLVQPGDTLRIGQRFF